MIKFGRSIPIVIHPIFWLIVAVIGWLNAQSFVGTLIWVGVILFSLLVHEFGHALTAKAFGQTVQIELVAMGGVTFHEGKKLKKWQDFLIVLMGPLASLILAGGAYLARNALGSSNAMMITSVLTLIVFINIFWTIINLLPILPLDGGQLLRIILEGIFGAKGLKFTLLLGVILASIMGVVCFIMGIFLVGAIMLLLAFESFTSWNQVKNMTSQDRDENNQKELEAAQDELRLGRFDAAKEKLDKVRSKAQKGILFDAASEQLAFIYEKEGQIDKVYELLKQASSSLSIQGKCLLHRAAYYNKDYPLTLNLGSRCFQEIQSYEIALINAMASAHLKEVRSCVGWLECALKHGLPNFQEAIQKNEFDSIRNESVFKQFIDSH